MGKLVQFISHRSMATKLAAMTIAGVISMVLVALTVLMIARGQLLTERAEKAHAIADAVWQMADAFQRAAEKGELTQEEAKARFFAASGNIWFENHANYAFIYDYETGLCVMNSGVPTLLGKDMRNVKDANGLPFASIMMDMAKTKGQGTIRYTFLKSSTDPTPLDKIAYVRGFAPWHMMIGVAEYMSDVDTAFWSMFWTASMVIGVLMLLSIVVAWAITRSVVKPLSALKEQMTALSEGKLNETIANTDRPDEVGEMARTVQVFQEAMLETNRLREEQGAVEQRQRAQRTAEMNTLADQFEGVVGQIITSVSTASSALESSAGTLTRTADEAEKVSNRAATASGDASSSVRSVAAASEELASSVHEISRQVHTSAEIAGEAVKQAEQTDARMAQLSQAAARIGAVVELINTIAGQTNLLALNATIEAARAGDAGRGFAVVAAEVKTLSDQTAKATGEITQQIADIQAATHESVAGIKEISATIARISEISSSIASAVEEQSAATKEISRNVMRAADGTSEVASNIANVQRGASETGSASSQVLSAAQTLSSESDRLRREVGKFMDTVRAA
jgi:methyl-accepting chemotaxis protein